MRYLITVGEDENGPVVADEETGMAYLFTTNALACEVAKRLVKENPALGGAFVHKMSPVAFYLPVKAGAETLVDETVVHPEKKETDDESN